MAIKEEPISFRIKEDYVLTSVQKILESIYQLAVPIKIVVEKNQVTRTYNKHTEEMIAYYKKVLEERKKVLFGQYVVPSDSGT